MDATAYLCDAINDIPKSAIERLFKQMPQERRERALRYRFERDRDLCVLAYGLLLFGLQEEYGITEPPRLTYSANGKPYLTDYPDVFFNMSHCAEGVVCAVSNAEIGIDIQDIRPYSADVARHVCTSDEMSELAHNAEPERLFCKLWVVKESYIKLNGGSIAAGLSDISAKEILSDYRGKALVYEQKRYILCGVGAFLNDNVDWRIRIEEPSTFAG